MTMKQSTSSLSQQLKTQRQAILRIAQIYGAKNLRIFGSVARGEDDDKSDLDLLVDLEPGRSLFDLGGLAIDLQDLLGCSVDVVTEKGLKQRIRDLEEIRFAGRAAPRFARPRSARLRLIAYCKRLSNYEERS